jgi:hypothetical protein
MKPVRYDRSTVSLIVVVGALALVLQGCNEPETTESCSLETQAAFNQSAGDWRSDVERLIRDAPPDSLVYVTFGDLTLPKEEFADLVEGAGGKVVYIFQTLDAVLTRISVQLLTEFYARTDLYGYIGIGKAGENVLLTPTPEKCW